MGTVIHKLLLIFLLLCFQTQTLAAVVLSCAHGGSGADVVADACHQPVAAAAEKSDSDTPEAPCFDCHECQLGCAFGVAALSYGHCVAFAPGPCGRGWPPSFPGMSGGVYGGLATSQRLAPKPSRGSESMSD